MTESVELCVNDVTRRIPVTAGQTLLSVLRDTLKLRGTKLACGSGECGACTVLVGGRPVMACITLAFKVRAPVETIEGLASETQHLRESFADHGAFQCGYCTPGQIVRAAALLRSGSAIDEAQIRHAISGNICRCTGYAQIVTAIHDVAATPAALEDRCP